MLQAMVLMGILVLCAVIGVLLYLSRWTAGPDEPTGSYAAPTPPAPCPRPATVVPVLPPPATLVPELPPVADAPGLPPSAVAVPEKAARPLPTEISAAPPRSAPASAVRRGRNSGFDRFAPAPARARAGRS